MHCAVVALLLAAPLAADDKADADALRALEASFQRAIERAEPSVACILVDRSGGAPFDPTKPEFVPESYGSGVVIDERGLVLTNEHVVHEARHLYVRLPGDKASYATVLASDMRSDLAVLQLERKMLPVKAIKLGDGGQARKGQLVLSLANPFAAGFRDGSPSASWGIISNVRLRGPGPPREELRDKPLYRYGTLLQLDARLNLGCSGGALIDLKGELIGLTTALAAITGSETAGGYALPLDAGMKRVLDKLKQGEEVEYGFLGVSMDTGPGRRGEGVPIKTVIPGGPADQARINNGALILAIDGVRVHDYDELFLHVGTHLAGSKVHVQFARAPGAPPEVREVILGKFYVPPDRFYASKPPRAVGGLVVDHASILPQRLNDRFLTNPVPAGVVIRDVLKNSAAELQAQLQPDRVITHVNGRPVLTPAEFYREVDSAGGPVELTLGGAEGRPPDKVRLDPR